MVLSLEDDCDMLMQTQMEQSLTGIPIRMPAAIENVFEGLRPMARRIFQNRHRVDICKERRYHSRSKSYKQLLGQSQNAKHPSTASTMTRTIVNKIKSRMETTKKENKEKVITFFSSIGNTLTHYKQQDPRKVGVDKRKLSSSRKSKSVGGGGDQNRGGNSNGGRNNKKSSDDDNNRIRLRGWRWQHCVSGAVAGGVVEFLMFPLDTLKTRLQTNSSIYTTMVSSPPTSGTLSAMRSSAARLSKQVSGIFS